MNPKSDFHIVTVGVMTPVLLESLWDSMASRTRHHFSHIVHPRYTPGNFPVAAGRTNFHWLRRDDREPMPEQDQQFLASLEQPGVPSIHNMILGDSIVAKLRYDDALRYATFLARRLTELFAELRPSVVLGSFDATHSGMALAVARRLEIPWFAMNFSVLPQGLTCFCDEMSPAATVQLTTSSPSDLQDLAEASLLKFESRAIKAPAYIPPAPRSRLRELARLPARLPAVVRTIKKRQVRDVVQFTEDPTNYSIAAVFAQQRRARAARRAIATVDALERPPSAPYVLFGLHMQPESTIDVWAPLFSNQIWVIELLSRSIPPSHKLLIKIHKSDDAKYSKSQLKQIKAFPGVEIIRPFADARAFIDNAALVIAIQGTMGLEGALLGKPVIMLGTSRTSLFPSVSTIGPLADLPCLVRKKLSEAVPARAAIIKAYAAYLSPFLPASYNDWRVKKTDGEIDGYGRLFDALRAHVETRPVSA